MIAAASPTKLIFLFQICKSLIPRDLFPEATRLLGTFGGVDAEEVERLLLESERQRRNEHATPLHRALA